MSFKQVEINIVDTISTLKAIMIIEGLLVSTDSLFKLFIIITIPVYHVYVFTNDIKIDAS